jgi:TonB family protein
MIPGMICRRMTQRCRYTKAPRNMHTRIIVIVSIVAVVSLRGIVTARAQDSPSARIESIGGNVSAPRAIYQTEPEFSEAARRAKYQGICVLHLVVGADGVPRDIKVVTSLGMGLDENAVAAVQKWRFSPALKDGEPVAVRVAIEVDFHLAPKRIEKLARKASGGDANAWLDLANAYFEGREVGKSETVGLAYLKNAANLGLPRAQFLMGEHTAHDASGDFPKAYMWYTLARRGGYKRSDEALKQLTARMTPEQLQAGQTQVDTWKPATPK